MLSLTSPFPPAPILHLKCSELNELGGYLKKKKQPIMILIGATEDEMFQPLTLKKKQQPAVSCHARLAETRRQTAGSLRAAGAW